MTGATQILFHSITREKLKSTAPDIFIRPEVGAFGALDYFKMRRNFPRRRARQGTLKSKLSQMLDGVAVDFSTADLRQRSEFRSTFATLYVLHERHVNRR